MKRIGLSLVIILLVAMGVFADWPEDHTLILKKEKARSERLDIQRYIMAGGSTTIGPAYVVLTEKDYEFLRSMLITYYNIVGDLTVTFLTNKWGEESTRRRFTKDNKFIMDKVEEIDKQIQEQLK